MGFNNVVVYRISKHNPGVGKRLAKALGNCEIVTSKTKTIPDGTLIVNYGRSDLPAFHLKLIASEKSTSKYFNWPSNVGLAVDKSQTLECLNHHPKVPTIDFTDWKIKVRQWLLNGHKVIGRKTTVGKQGKGIILIDPEKIENPKAFIIPDCPLYTKYFDKTHEFRVHVCNGKVVDFVQKKKMGKVKLAKWGLDKPNLLTRNHKKGWIFAHNKLICDSSAREEIETLGLRAVAALGLDFGGVDILAKFEGGNNKGKTGILKEALVCEVNSAPGMRCKATFDGYVNEIKSILEGN